MYIDSTLKFSDAQALTATADSTNVIDLGTDRNIGKGEPMALVISVGVAADGTTTDETYQFQLETDDNAAMSSSTIIGDLTIGYADLTLGSKHVIPMGLTNERYLQVVYTLGGTTPTITVDAWLSPMSLIDATDEYPSGFTVS